VEGGRGGSKAKNQYKKTVINFQELTIKKNKHQIIFFGFTAPDIQEVTPTLSPMRDVIVPEGSPAQFRTQVSGKPQPTIQWLRDGLVIPQSADFQVRNHFNF
jgi:hypothetical protein